MENYENEKDYFINEVFKKAYFAYWDTEAEYSKAIDDLFDHYANGKLVKESKIKDLIKGMEKTQEIRERLEERKQELREAEKKLQCFR